MDRKEHHRNSKKKLKIFFFSCINAVFLLWLTFLLLGKTYPYDDESFLIKWSSVLFDVVLKPKEKPDPDRFAFINVAWDKALIDKYDEFGFPEGNEVITDRKKLAELLHILNQKPQNHKFIFIDVFLKESSPYDSLLQSELIQLKNYCVSYHRDDDTLLYPDFKANCALADYDTYEDMLLKYRLQYKDTIKTVPLYMYENIYQEKIKSYWGYSTLNDDAIFSSFILGYRLRNYDFFKNRSDTTGLVYNKNNLGQLLEIGRSNPDFIHQLTRNKIIIIGDFIHDVHETIYGEMPGSIILLNAFLALENGDNIISWYFILFLFLCYLLVSYNCFDTEDSYDKWIKKIVKTKALEFVATFTGYIVIFGIISIISYLMFNIHLTILVLAFYMNILEKAYIFIRKKYFLKEKVSILDSIKSRK